ncbi:hypothetical protein QUA00_35720, partial [Microcoleus sp. T2B6]|uniref:hypothetical protein n=1 Tax=Microcoleus sp. T2B6 TaxID=3055424 RepID=UPI002FD0B912
RAFFLNRWRSSRTSQKPPLLSVGFLTRVIASVNFSLAPKDYFLNKILKIRLFFWGKKLDFARLTMYYLIMGIVTKFKFMSPLPLSKIYPKNQQQSIGKNSFLYAAI